ncbi:23S rRNA (adenine(2030)-N(6))-methyltransferase RlmJ [Pararhodobacter sp. SW119]|uniref:23S rRNA (adenine(2030)-N(6))-methyltransferase RlmJ n=1 Tax=Pararhodobacter sp. SW119 TaxID=2780075 RepID=UPI001AE06C8B|nr:23S rRNA (adenine(2030)-N(6))-methyltransferase RlmJ [Pararhodobacter sp. SW119]
MLSYQHLYHAGNLADVHKHALLAWMLGYLTGKPKPLSYLETHAGRGLYDLDAPEARKTGEAAQGIARVGHWFGPDHPYAQAIAATRATHGAAAYPGSPLIASALLRPEDRLHLAEAHPAEHAALAQALPWEAQIRHEDGFAMARARVPPTPRRGLMMIDPSYEVAADYTRMPDFIATMARKWPVGVIVLWYPILTDARHQDMLTDLHAKFPEALRHEVGFPPARPGHRMVGSGLFVVNAPWGLEEEAARLATCFATLPGQGNRA